MPLGATQGGGRRGASVKTLKKMLKKAGLKTSGRKAALTRRAKKAHLKMRGGELDANGNEIAVVKGGACAKEGEPGYDAACVDAGRRRRRGTRSRKH